MYPLPLTNTLGISTLGIAILALLKVRRPNEEFRHLVILLIIFIAGANLITLFCTMVLLLDNVIPLLAQMTFIVGIFATDAVAWYYSRRWN